MNKTTPRVVRLGTNPRRLRRVLYVDVLSRRVQYVPGRQVSGGDYGMGGPEPQDLVFRAPYTIHTVEYIACKRRILHVPGFNSRRVLKPREMKVTETQFNLLDGVPMRRS